MTARILIAGNDRINTKLSAVVLQRNGYYVNTVETGVDVVTFCETTLTDLVLMDTGEPGFDGLEVTRQLRANPATGNPCIVVTLPRNLEDNDRGILAAGCDGYLTRPVYVHDLPTLLDGCLRERRKKTQSLNTFVPCSFDEVVDFEVFKERAGGDEQLMREVIALFLKDSPRSLRDMRTALRARDNLGLAAAAHTLRGTLGNVSAGSAVAAASAVEHIARSGDLSDAIEACNFLALKVGSVQAILNRVSKEVPS